MRAYEDPTEEIYRLRHSDLLTDRFRFLLEHALAEGLLPEVMRPTSWLAMQRALGPISIAVIVRRRDHRPQKIQRGLPALPRLTMGWSLSEVLKAFWASLCRVTSHGIRS